MNDRQLSWGEFENRHSNLNVWDVTDLLWTHLITLNKIRLDNLIKSSNIENWQAHIIEQNRVLSHVKELLYYLWIAKSLFGIEHEQNHDLSNARQYPPVYDIALAALFVAIANDKSIVFYQKYTELLTKYSLQLRETRLDIVEDIGHGMKWYSIKKEATNIEIAVIFSGTYWCIIDPTRMVHYRNSRKIEFLIDNNIFVVAASFSKKLGKEFCISISGNLGDSHAQDIDPEYYDVLTYRIADKVSNVVKGQLRDMKKLYMLYSRYILSKQHNCLTDEFSDSEILFLFGFYEPVWVPSRFRHPYLINMRCDEKLKLRFANIDVVRDRYPKLWQNLSNIRYFKSSTNPARPEYYFPKDVTFNYKGNIDR
jgi:hypothetical protein